MAETVQFRAEESIPELEQLERVGLFTRPEIRAIHKQRNALEYKIARIHKAKESYLKYIQYEISVLSLIKKRREKIGYMHKKKEIDSVIGKRISRLFKAVIRRYPADTKLWITHREFLKKMKWHDNMSGVLTNMLQVHNKSPELWVTVAKWEMEESKSADTARQLLQRAIRFHPNSELIWQEYFRMELIYVEQVRNRRDVLGLKEDNDDAILEAKIPQVVFKQAVKTIKNAEFAISFIPIAKEFNISSVIEIIYQHLIDNCGDSEAALNCLAQRCLESQKILTNGGSNNKSKMSFKEEQMFIAYEDAVQRLSTEPMYNFYMQAILDRIKTATKQSKSLKLVQKMVKIATRASELGLLSKRMHIERLKLLHSCGQLDQARSAALQGVKNYPSDPILWQFCLMLHVTSEIFFLLFEQAIGQVSDTESMPIWNLAVEWASLRSTKLEKVLEMAILRAEPIGSNFKSVYLKMSAILNGLDAARALYKRLKAMSPLSVDFFKEMVQIEKAQFKPDVNCIKRCYNDAIIEFGSSSVEIWLDFARFELEHPLGNPQNIGTVYNSAIKKLTAEKCDQFIASFTLLQSHTNGMEQD